MYNHRILFQLLHLHVSIYMTIFRVLTGYISVVLCEVQYNCIYILDFVQDNSDVLYEHCEDGHTDRNMYV